MRSTSVYHVLVWAGITALLVLGCTPEKSESSSDDTIAGSTGGGAIGGNGANVAGIDGTAMDSPGDGAEGGETGSGMPSAINMCQRTVPESSVCNPYCNLGCQRGEHCTVANNTLACVPTGSKTIGTPCQNSSDCGPQMACFKLDGEDIETCRQFCITDGQCPDGRKCELSVNIPMQPTHTFCSDLSMACNPFANGQSTGDAGGAIGMVFEIYSLGKLQIRDWRQRAKPLG